MATDVTWYERLRRSGVLTLDTSGVTSGAWKTAVAAAIRELNDLFTTHRIGVQLADGSDAQVKVALSSGAYKYTVEGKEKTGTLNTEYLLHGYTHVVEIQTRRGKFGEYGYVFLPDKPRIDKKNPRSRLIGEPAMRVIAAHEFLHAVGLTDHDTAQRDVMSDQWALSAGDRPADDKMHPSLDSATMYPPLKLAGTSVTRLKAIWPQAQRSTQPVTTP